MIPWLGSTFMASSRAWIARSSRPHRLWHQPRASQTLRLSGSCSAVPQRNDRFDEAMHRPQRLAAEVESLGLSTAMLVDFVERSTPFADAIAPAGCSGHCSAKTIIKSR